MSEGRWGVRGSPCGVTVGSSTVDVTVGSSTVGVTVGSSTVGVTVGSSTVGVTVGSSTVGGDKTIRLWDAQIGSSIYSLTGHQGSINIVAWSPDGRYIASGSFDFTVRIWESETGRQTHLLASHTSSVVSISFIDDGRLLVSLGENGTLVIWRTDTWVEVAHINKICATGFFSNLASSPKLPIMAIRAEDRHDINIWDVDIKMLRGAGPDTPSIHYVNAKAVLLGESGVGKSGLGIRLAEGIFRTTESTHGAQFWHLPLKNVPNLPSHLKAELTLWDLAGQPEYRLVHQLFLDDTDAALLLFDCSDANDPLRGVPFWAKVLKKIYPHSVKFLVSSRCDVSPVTMDRQQIMKVLIERGLDEYIETSAKSGIGVQHLFERLLEDIPWQELPCITTPRLFQVIREFLLGRKAEDKDILIPMEVIKKEVDKRYMGHNDLQQEIDAAISLLQAQGLVYRLNPRPELILVLIRPELINQYASSIIQAARNHQLGIGVVLERDVLVGKMPFSGFNRLPEDQERIVLEATTELLIQHDLCFREMGFLIFPSQINVIRAKPFEARPHTEVTYRFSGNIDLIYASLVVRLSYTDYFKREGQWKYAVEFTRSGERLGFSMHQVEEGTGELDIYFYPGINEFDRITFIRFITDHLRAKGIDIQEEIRIYCPECKREIKNREAIEERVKKGFLDIPCQFCSGNVLISKSIEERYEHEPTLVNKQQELKETVGERTEKEVEQFRSDPRQYAKAEDQLIHVLHLSDLHLENEGQAQVFQTQLEADLNFELGIEHLEHIVISGDITNHASEDEYKAAFKLVDSLVKRFGLDANRVIIVPGNHDINWDDSEAAYKFVPKRKMPNSLPEAKYFLAGDEGALICDEALYSKRFFNFNEWFYKRVYIGAREYPLDYDRQSVIFELPDDHILFLALNSCWQIDHHFQNRASIKSEALAKALDQLQKKEYDDWLKIAVWHHPVTGRGMMNNEFIDQLIVHGFHICMHGHIHEAIEEVHKYDDERGMHIIGAGTFGASKDEQISGIPLQYNLLTFDPSQGEMVVRTRKREKPDGAWSADPRWGDRNDPKPWYRFKVKNYQLHK